MKATRLFKSKRCPVFNTVCPHSDKKCSLHNTIAQYDRSVFTVCICIAETNSSHTSCLSTLLTRKNREENPWSRNFCRTRHKRGETLDNDNPRENEPCHCTNGCCNSSSTTPYSAWFKESPMYLCQAVQGTGSEINTKFVVGIPLQIDLEAIPRFYIIRLLHGHACRYFLACVYSCNPPSCIHRSIPSRD